MKKFINLDLRSWNIDSFENCLKSKKFEKDFYFVVNIILTLKIYYWNNDEQKKEEMFAIERKTFIILMTIEWNVSSHYIPNNINLKMQIENE